MKNLSGAVAAQWAIGKTSADRYGRPMRSRQKKQWRDLSPVQRRLVVVGGALEAALAAVALTDLARRPAAQVHGPKALWALACVVQPVGPIAYLARGRRRP